MECGMNEEDIEEMLSYKYWPVVDIDGEIFVAKLYKKKTRGKNKGWRQIKESSFQTPVEAWEYLRKTLLETLKFMI